MFLFLYSYLTTLVYLVGACSAQIFPASFVFGDSLLEAGNNNYIPTLSRANYVPNGIDFGRPTGRFSNGRTIVDIIGQQLGFKDFTPPYYAPTTVGKVLLHGVNYASGAAGILDKTGYVFGDRINMDKQLDNFEKTKEEISSCIGVPAALELLSKSIFFVTMGSNDFINNYLTAILSIPEQISVPPETKVDFLDQRLYTLGARKIVVANVGPLGCIPCERDQNPSTGDDCVPFPNKLTKLFNSKLKHTIMEFNTSLPGSLFVYADVHRIVVDIIQNYKFHGFENYNSACCRAAGILGGKFGGLVPCLPTNEVCPDRSKYVFWDAYHPSEATNAIIAMRLLKGNSSDILPMNVRQLAEA